MPKKKQTRRKAVRRRRVAQRSSVQTLSIPKVECRPYFKVPGPEATGENFWNVPDLCAACNWPAGLPGGGVIALVEYGGGWTQSDLDQFFAGLSQPAPGSH